MWATAIAGVQDYMPKLPDGDYQPEGHHVVLLQVLD